MEGGTHCIFNPVEWNCLIFAGQNIRHIPYSLDCSVKDAPKISGLWDCTFSCVPGAAHCISPQMDFYCYIFVTLSAWDLNFLPPCIPVSACVWLYGNAVAEEPHLQCWGGVSGVGICPSLNKFHQWTFCYFSINEWFDSLLPYLEQGTKSSLDQETEK